MNNFYHTMMRTVMALVICVPAAGMIGLTACKTEGAAVKVAVTYATMKYIDSAGPAESVNRAARVAAVANQALAAVESESFDLSQFTVELVQNLPADLPPSDKALAVALIGLIGDELTLRIEGGVLTPEKRVKVRKVLGWVEEATSYYEGR